VQEQGRQDVSEVKDGKERRFIYGARVCGTADAPGEIEDLFGEGGKEGGRGKTVRLEGETRGALDCAGTAERGPAQEWAESGVEKESESKRVTAGNGQSG